MKTIADLWPLLVIAGIGFCLYAGIRLARRFSPGAVSAGPKTPPDSLIKGQSDTAEGLRTIEKRLDTRPDSMIQRIEASCAELGVAIPRVIPGASPEQHIDVLLGQLEAHLGLDFAQHTGAASLSVTPPGPSTNHSTTTDSTTNDMRGTAP